MLPLLQRGWSLGPRSRKSCVLRSWGKAGKRFPVKMKYIKRSSHAPWLCCAKHQGMWPAEIASQKIKARGWWDCWNPELLKKKTKPGNVCRKKPDFGDYFVIIHGWKDRKKTQDLNGLICLFVWVQMLMVMVNGNKKKREEMRIIGMKCISSQVNQQNQAYHCGPCVDFLPKSVFQTLGAVQELL